MRQGESIIRIPGPLFLCEPDLGHYAADAFFVCCLDARFHEMKERLINFLNLQKIDPESPAGGAKIFSSPEDAGDRDFMLREFLKSRKLHGTKRIVLCTHHDCGAYGGFAAFRQDEHVEYARHREEHNLADKFLHQKLSSVPDLAIEHYFLSKRGPVKIEGLG